MLGMPKLPGPYRRILAGTMGAAALDKAPADLVRVTYRATRTPGFGTTVSRYLREMFRGAQPGAPRYELSDGELGEVAAVVTVVMGDEDLAPNAPEVTRRVALIPQGRLAWVHGGHEPWWDDVEGCAHAVAGSLANTSA